MMAATSWAFIAAVHFLTDLVQVFCQWSRDLGLEVWGLVCLIWVGSGAGLRLGLVEGCEFACWTLGQGVGLVCQIFGPGRRQCLRLV